MNPTSFKFPSGFYKSHLLLYDDEDEKLLELAFEEEKSPKKN